VSQTASASAVVEGGRPPLPPFALLYSSFSPSHAVRCSIRIAFKREYGTRWAAGRELYSDRSSDHLLTSMLARHLRTWGFRLALASLIACSRALFAWLWFLLQVLLLVLLVLLMLLGLVLFGLFGPICCGVVCGGMAFFAEPTNMEAVDCSNCRKRGHFERQTVVYDPPKHLLLSLTRMAFSQEHQKTVRCWGVAVGRFRASCKHPGTGRACCIRWIGSAYVQAVGVCTVGCLLSACMPVPS
jgi:hypothetical protein